ncbi:unnamed protein product [Rotaria socialis]|nr:unnamed protein product [Rotaria socialis]
MILFLFFYHRYHRQKFYFNSLKKQSDHSCKSSNQANDIQNTLQTYIIYNEPKEHHPNNENKSLDEQDNQNLFTTTDVNTLVDIQSGSHPHHHCSIEHHDQCINNISTNEDNTRKNMPKNKRTYINNLSHYPMIKLNFDDSKRPTTFSTYNNQRLLRPLSCFYKYENDLYL